MKSSVLKVLPSASVHVTPAEAAEKLRARCAHGACSSSWAFVCGSRSTQWVATLVSGAPNLLDTTGRLVLGQVLNRFSSCLRVDAASKLTHQVEEFFAGREGWTKLYSMAPLYDEKNIWCGLFASFRHEQLVVDSRTEQTHRAGHDGKSLALKIGHSHKWRVLTAATAVAKRQQWSKAQVQEDEYQLRPRQEQRRCPLPRGESSKWQLLFFAILACSIWP